MKKIIQDVVPPEDKKSIRDIPVPDRTMRSKFASQKEKKKETDKKPATNSTPNNKEGNNMKLGIILFSILAFFLVWVVIASFLSEATINITRYSINTEFSNEQATVEYGPTSNVAKIISTSVETSTTAKATGEEFVEKNASGQIVVYNNFDKNEQILIERTRFESPEGKIYRIRESVTVPPKNGDTPGSIEVTVYADEPGNEYNIGLVDFTIPGFEGTPRFDGFYARSKTSIEGGFSGTIKKIAETDLQRAQSDLENKANEQIFTKAESEIPDGYMYYPNLAVVTNSALEQGQANGDSVEVTMKTTLTMPVFSKDELSTLLASDHIDTTLSEKEPYVEEPEKLTVDYVDPVVFGNDGNLSIAVSGNAKILWPLDTEKIKKELAGISRSKINEVFSKYKTVQQVKAKVKPFWKSKFPKNSQKIEIVYKDKN